MQQKNRDEERKERPLAASATAKWAGYPNLHRRPHAPNKGRGRLQRQLARAAIASGKAEISSTVFLDFAYPRKRSISKRLSMADRYSVWRILKEIAVPIGRVGPRHAILWRLNPDGRSAGADDRTAGIV